MNHDSLRFGIAVVLLFALAGCIPATEKQPPLNESLRPWKNDAERVEMMFAVAAFAAGTAHTADGNSTGSNDPTPNACIQRTLEELHKPQDNGSAEPQQLQEDVKKTVEEPTDSSPVNTRQAEIDIDPDPLHDCRDALRSCGNCHMPKQNNCNYTVEFSKDAKTVQRAFGQFDVAADGTLSARRGSFKDEEDESTAGGTIAPKDVIRTTWRNGADPVITWWNFETLNGRGSTAKRMMAIATQHDVACSNCHVGHGDFQLTKEGETFFETGKVIRRVPLKEMLGK